MGEHDAGQHDEADLRAFTRALLEDVQALERLLEREDLFDPVRHVGAEQEMFLVDRAMHPAPVGPEVLARIDDERLTSELARFNLEANASPRVFGGSCLRDLHAELLELVGAARAAAAGLDADVVLTGILPTLRQRDLGLDAMTPEPRYRALNEAMTEARGGDFHVLIEGLDDLEVRHDNVLFEACNTSFQAHFQVGPRELARTWNVAQLITAPLLAAAANSPVLLGRRLWRETRVALFQQSVDTRAAASGRPLPSRIGFGSGWVEKDVVELYREAIARYRILIAREVDGSSLATLREGRAPELSALQLFNSTTYPWNRPCYGVADGVAHLRIEARALPAGPTVVDEVANAALYFGLLAAGPGHYGDPREKMRFDDAKANFLAAARTGLRASLRWIDGRDRTAAELIAEELLPLAREGLCGAGVDAADVDRYLGVIEARAATDRTGASWALGALERLAEKKLPRDRAMQALTRAMLELGKQERPVHEWDEAAAVHPGAEPRETYGRVEQLMTRDLFTVRPGDLVDLAACLMDWEHVRHVPVENDEGELVGVVSHRSLLRLMARGARRADGGEPVAIASIMRGDPITCAPETPTLEAIRIMRKNKVSCLPVVEKGRLVGLLTDRDLIEVAAAIIEAELS